MNIEINTISKPKEKKIIAFEVTKDWFDILKKVAEREFISVSSLIRKLIYKECIEQELAAKLEEGKESKNGKHN